MLVPYAGALIGGILLILLSACIATICACCLHKRRSKEKATKYEQLLTATGNEKLAINLNKKYSQLLDPEVALTNLTCSARNEAQLNSSSPSKSYSSVPQQEVDDAIQLESGIESDKTSLESSIFDGKLSKASLAKYQNDSHGTCINLEHYKPHLDKLLVEEGMESEFKALGGHELRYEYNRASLLHNVSRNKYKLIYPYDRSRVVVKETAYVGSDFINASHIPGFYSPEHFIAAQAPKTNTLNSFWQMIWEQRILSIVMLTNLEEMGKTKCIQYWPDSVRANVEYGSVSVSLLKEDTSRGCVTRELLVSRLNQKQFKIKQFHYTAWPDHDVPELYDNFLVFVQGVKSRQMKIGSPVLVHCSAGVGRSGVFIALYNLLDAVGRGEAISVYRVVNEMREYRPHMVQTFPQYKYIYLATLEIIMGGTSIANEDLRDTYTLYLQAEQPGYLSVFRLQFEELSYQSEKSFAYPSTISAKYADKNPISSVLAYDRNRVILTYLDAKCEYINASYMSPRIVATFVPSTDTLEQFLQLLCQLDDPVVVILLTQREHREMREGACDRVSYWREERGRKVIGNFNVETEDVIRSPFFVQQRMGISSNTDKEKRYFSQFISLSWTEDGKITDLTAISTLLDHVSILLADTPSKNAVFCCNDSIGKTGIMLTAYRAVMEMRETHSFDVFQTVKRLRSARRNMVPTIDHYVSCYSLLDEYCRMNITV